MSSDNKCPNCGASEGIYENIIEADSANKIPKQEAEILYGCGHCNYYWKNKDSESEKIESDERNNKYIEEDDQNQFPYVVIEALSEDSLQKKVCKLLKAGYDLYGDLVVANRIDEYNKPYLLYIQVLKQKSEDNNPLSHCKILSNYNLDQLETKINELLKEGYDFNGDIKIVNSSGGGTCKPLYIQTMIKKHQ